MKGLFLLCLLPLFIGCEKKILKEKPNLLSEQTVKPEKMSEKRPEGLPQEQAMKPEAPVEQAMKLKKMSEKRPEDLSQQAVEQEEIEWFIFSDGIKKAKAEKKPLMVHFTADWCGWCKKLEVEAFKSQEVISLSASFVSVKVDSDKEIEITKKFQIRGLPTILFISPEGNVIHQVFGYRATDAFLSEMKTALSKVE